MYPMQFGSKGEKVVFKTQRLRVIKRRAKALQWLAELDDPASLARTPSESEIKEVQSRLAQAGGDWMARTRGLK